MAQTNRAKVALNLNKLRKISDFIQRIRGIVTNFINNAVTLGTPSPTTTVVSGHVDDLQTAEDAVATKTLGTVTTRNLKLKVVKKDIFKWQNYVQDQADAAPDLESALNIISQSGFDVKMNGHFAKPDLRIKPQPTPGVVKIYAKSAGKNVSYNWQQSINNGVQWTDLLPTNVANTMVSGLTSKSSYSFRFRSVVKNVVSAWSAPVSIVIQ